jgi:hypothetical protein
LTASHCCFATSRHLASTIGNIGTMASESQHLFCCKRYACLSLPAQARLSAAAAGRQLRLAFGSCAWLALRHSLPASTPRESPTMMPRGTETRQQSLAACGPHHGSSLRAAPRVHDPPGIPPGCRRRARLGQLKKLPRCHRRKCAHASHHLGPPPEVRLPHFHASTYRITWAHHKSHGIQPPPRESELLHGSGPHP